MLTVSYLTAVILLFNKKFRCTSVRNAYGAKEIQQPLYPTSTHSLSLSKNPIYVDNFRLDWDKERLDLPRRVRLGPCEVIAPRRSYNRKGNAILL